ncbi:Os05g0380400, partial [Oryza sativa Japonica Group]
RLKSLRSWVVKKLVTSQSVKEEVLKPGDRVLKDK